MNAAVRAERARLARLGFDCWWSNRVRNWYLICEATTVGASIGYTLDEAGLACARSEMASRLADGSYFSDEPGFHRRAARVAVLLAEEGGR